MPNRQMIQAKVASIAEREGLDLSVTFDGTTVTLRQNGNTLFEADQNKSLWAKLLGFEAGARAKGDGLTPGPVDVRWVRSESYAEGGELIIGWASLHVGPLYLNNIMLVERSGGEMAVMWPRMRERGFFWWKPDARYEERLEAHILESVLGKGVTK